MKKSKPALLLFMKKYDRVSLGDFMKKQMKGSLCLLLGTIIWGSAFVAQSIGIGKIGPFSFQAIRCLLAVIGLAPIIAISDRKIKDGKNFFTRFWDKKLLKAGILCGLPLSAACILQQMALVDTDAGKSAFLTAMYIVIVPLIGIFLKKKPPKAIPVCVVLAVAGLYCLSCIGVTSIRLSDLLLLGCAFMFAVQIVCVDIFATDVDALRLNLLQGLVCAITAGIITAFVETPTWDGVLASAIPLAYAGFLSMGAAYSLQIIGQRNVESAIASLIMSLESVFAVIFGAVILKERLTGWEAAGCVLVFAAVVLSQIPFPEKVKERH